VLLLVGSLLGSAGAVGRPSTAWAQPKGNSKTEEATTRYKQGVKLFEEQDFNAALLEFRKAYELAPNYKVTYNIGQVYYQIQNYAKALQWFERYLSEGGKDVSPDRRAEVQKEIDELKRRVGRVELQSDVKDVEVSIDDEPVGKTPLTEPLIVSAGRRKISATKQGYAPFSQTIEVAGQEVKKVPLQMVALVASTPGPAPGPTTPPTAPPPKKEESKFTTASWVGVGAAGALGLGAAITGILAMSASSDTKAALYAGTNRAEVDDKNDRRKALALTTDVLAGAAVVTLGLTLVLTYTRNTETASAQRGPSVTVGASPRGAWLQGQF
jgi:hypothetical protein